MNLGPCDPGLQLQQTLLSWRRLCLPVAIGGLAEILFTEAPQVVGAFDFGCKGLLPFCVACFATERPYRWAHAALVEGLGLPSGGLPLFPLTMGVSVLGLAGMAFIVGSSRS